MSSNNVSLNFERRDCLNEWLHNRKLRPFFMEEQAKNEFNHYKIRQYEIGTKE